MSTLHAYYEYMPADNAQLFTFIMLPDKSGQFPTVIMRSPYVDVFEDQPEEQIVDAYVEAHKDWAEHGYAVVFQHCRGRGKSGGDCVPYINERADGLALLDFIRKQPFYNGELFLNGGSYCCSVHYAVAPFASDIKGAVLAVQDTERYNVCYRNGVFKRALHGNWYVGMYKAKTMKEKHFDDKSFEMLPLCDFTKTVFGEAVDSFDDMLRAPHRDDAFWRTHAGGTDSRDALKNVKIPVLITTGFYDIYTGGMFDLWNEMSDDARRRCAMVVSPHNHGDGYDTEDTIRFEGAHLYDRMGGFFERVWCDYVRGVRSEPPAPLGKVTYYRSFENTWRSDDFAQPTTTMTLPLGHGEVSYDYDPLDPPRLKGGLSCNFGGTAFQDPPGSRDDIITVYTDPFADDTFIKGNMTATLTVCSDCEDTAFLTRISIQKEQGDYALRDDITSLVYQLGDYTPNSNVKLTFSFDEHAFLIKKGERLRVDILSADAEHYVRHTNQKGLYCEQTTVKTAHNTVDLSSSFIMLPIEK